MKRFLIILAILVAQSIPTVAESREKDVDRWVDRDLWHTPSHAAWGDCSGFHGSLCDRQLGLRFFMQCGLREG